MIRSLLIGAAILLVAGVAIAADSPIDKGSLYLNGSLFFQSQSGDLYENGDGDAFTTLGLGNGGLGFDMSLDVQPTVGYFVARGVFLGAQAAFTRYAQGDNDLTLFAFGPSLGYFFNINSARTEVKGSIYPYIRGFFTYGSIGDGDEDLNVTQYGGKGGMLFMLSSAVAADAGVRFQGDSWKPDGADESITGTTISIGVGITAFIY